MRQNNTTTGVRLLAIGLAAIVAIAFATGAASAAILSDDVDVGDDTTDVVVEVTFSDEATDTSTADVEILNDAGTTVQEDTIEATEAGDVVVERYDVDDDLEGVGTYTVNVTAETEDDVESAETWTEGILAEEELDVDDDDEIFVDVEFAHEDEVDVTVEDNESTVVLEDSIAGLDGQSIEQIYNVSDDLEGAAEYTVTVEGDERHDVDVGIVSTGIGIVGAPSGQNILVGLVLIGVVWAWMRQG